MPTWDSAQYLKFAGARTQPAVDLAARIDLPAPRRIIDLGCGPGNSTAVLAARWPSAALTGLDSSPDMIAAARAAVPAATWLTGDIATWTPPESFDLVFSNAALQWVPDHLRVLSSLMGCVAPRGALAFQVPANLDAPAHRLMRDLAASESWRDRFQSTVREWQVADAATYYDLLAPLAARVELWETDYLHVVDGSAAIVDWYRGTGLRPWLEALENERARSDFLADYLTAITAAYPRRPDGRVLFPFRRLFMIAYR